ncbi:MAG: pyridoxamine 5'-phosphate oxidase [Micrococcales bacterium]|nr:MAG: pyridoxamine 5'-phosphate oxidase [Micrococcales bacterium]
MTIKTLGQLTRKSDRGCQERAALDELLDSVHTGVLSTVLDGAPWSVPMLFVRDGDRVLLHGSTGAGALQHVAAGAPVTLTVFSLDGLVLAWNAFQSSANYRSAVLRGYAKVLCRDEAAQALATLTDSLLPGRTAEIPSATTKEIAATMCLWLPIEDGSWLFKSRTGGSTPPPQGQTDTWTGVVPLRVVAGEPLRDSWNHAGVEVSDAVRAVVAAYPADGSPSVEEV